MDKPLVSVVTPCYNGAPYLEDYFESLLNQTYENIEMIFVNDGSKDDTEKIALLYKKRFEEKSIPFRYIYQENHGQANAVNNGFKYVNGKYLIWPDSDDILHDDSIRVRVDFLERHSNYDIARTNGYFFSHETREKIRRLSDNDNRFNEDIFLDLILEKTYCNCCYMIRWDAFKKIYPDLLIPESDAGQNWQILIPICGKSLCGYIDKDMYYVREHSDSHSRSKRDLEQKINRLNELKRLLLLGIDKSGRVDRNYERIVEIKYYRLFYFEYIKAKNKENSKKYMMLLKTNNELSFDDYLYYAKEFQPIRFKFVKYLAVFIKSEKSIYD